MPCSVVSVSGQIVKVKFELNAAPFTLPPVTLPIATSIYDWLPVQVGDAGVTLPADYYLGGISGLGGGVADLRQHGNLSTLVFQPISNKSWSVPDASQRVVQGPGGVLVRDTSNAATINTTPAQIELALGSSSIVLTSSTITLTVGAQVMQVTATGITLNGREFLNHEHSGVQSGTTNTGPVV